jgi:hypothetical protein
MPRAPSPRVPRVPRVNVLIKANMPEASSKIKPGGTMDADVKQGMPEFDVADSPIGKKAEIKT